MSKFNFNNLPVSTSPQDMLEHADRLERQHTADCFKLIKELETLLVARRNKKDD